MGTAPSRREVPSSASGGNQAQPKRPPTPHMFQEIVAEVKTAGAGAAALEDQVCTGIFLVGKTKKYWVDERTRHNCFMLFPRGMSIIWGEDPRYWTWQSLKERSGNDDTEVEVAVLQDVCWLEIHGKQELSHLTPGVTYEISFEVMLKERAYGWSVPVDLQLKFPDGTIQQHKEKLDDKPRGQWLLVKVGEVKPYKGQNGDLDVSMSRRGGVWKSGLLIKGIKITPKEDLVTYI